MRISGHEEITEIMTFICTDCGALSRHLSDRSGKLACCQACGAARGTNARLYERAARIGRRAAECCVFSLTLIAPLD